MFWTYRHAGVRACRPLIDNLTTALVLCAVVLERWGATARSFLVALACINIVVAANAGGAFTPFGDITTLMVWQAGKGPVQLFRVLRAVPAGAGELAACRRCACMPRCLGAPRSSPTHRHACVAAGW
jgi:Na+/H+ antiporter NhaD/arsenite permease-like protein